jgi:hypothetical protein
LRKKASFLRPIDTAEKKGFQKFNVSEVEPIQRDPARNAGNWTNFETLKPSNFETSLIRERAIMGGRNLLPKPADASVTIRVSGKLFQGHLSYLDQLVQSAGDCHLWPLLSLAGLEELDRSAIDYLIEGENRHFGLISCSKFVREWMEHERERPAA